jgi:hypothetical protein
VSGATTPAGWYPDPQDPSQQRYWDGSAWSAATQPFPTAPPPPPTGAFYGQPVGYGVAAGVAPPSNHLAFAVIATIVCGCFGGLLPLVPGVVSLVKASQVNRKWQAGDVAGAQAASTAARNAAIACVVVSIVWSIVLVATGIVDADFTVE